MHRHDFQLAHLKDFIVLQQVIEHPLVFFPGDAIPLSKPLLHLADPFADADLGFQAVLGSSQLLLEVFRCCQMVGVGVGLEDLGDGVVIFFDERKERVCGCCGDEVLDGVEVEDGVDDYGLFGGGVGDDILPC